MASLFDNLFGYKKVKLYDTTKTRKDRRYYQPFNYKDALINKNVSRHLLRNNTLKFFMIFVNDYLYNIIVGIRGLKNYKNYTVKKDDPNTK
jgi:hypothetical protein